MDLGQVRACPDQGQHERDGQGQPGQPTLHRLLSSDASKGTSPAGYDRGCERRWRACPRLYDVPGRERAAQPTPEAPMSSSSIPSAIRTRLPVEVGPAPVDGVEAADTPPVGVGVEVTPSTPPVGLGLGVGLGDGAGVPL
jgi:hypothetical protein